MLRKIIIFITSLIICLPLYAASLVQIDTEIEGSLVMKKYYSEISDATDISDELFYIDQDGINSSLEDVDNPFLIRDGFTTDNFIIAFFGSVETNQTYEIDVECTDYYYIDNSTNTYISLTPTIINKSPSNGQLSFVSGEFYEIGNLNSFSFQIYSPENNTVPAGRYFTDITINIVEL
ncbi:MAG: hypothetical protein ACPKM0_06090 [Pleomorphochaeta sp.]